MGVVPVRPQALGAVRGELHAWCCFGGDLDVGARRIIQAFLAAEEIEPEYDLRPDEDGVEPARHVRLCGPWRRDDG